MRRIFHWLRVIVPLIVLAGLIAGMGFWLTLPRVVEVFPAEGTVDAPAGSVLQMRFSRAMRLDDLQGRLTIEPQIPGELTLEGDTLVFNPAEPWPAGSTVQVSIAPGARPQAFPSLAMPVARTWSFIVRQPRLAFLYPADGPANISVRNPVTGEDEAITDISSGVLDYTVSPDGSRVIFSADNPQGGSDIYRLDISQRFTTPSSDAPTTVAPQAAMLVSCAPATCRSAVISPDGRYLAYVRSEVLTPGREAQTQIWILPLIIQGSTALSSVDAPGGPPQPLGDPTHSASLPNWSADSRLSYFDSRAEAFVVVTPEGEEQARFDNTTGQPGDWQPNGRAFIAPEIFFLEENFSASLQNELDRLSDSHLMLYEQSGAGRDLTEIEGIEDALPVFSPDGRTLAFARKYLSMDHWTPGRQLWLMDVVLRTARAMTDEADYNHFDFAWSPDGRQLAYVRFNQSLLLDPPEVWVLKVESGEKTMLTTGGYSPQWIP